MERYVVCTFSLETVLVVDLVLSLRPLRSWMTRRGMNATHQMKRSISHHHQPMKSHQRQPCPRCVTALVFVLVFVVLPLVSWKSCTSTFSLPHFGQVMMLPPSIIEQAIRNHEELCKLSMDADACFFFVQSILFVACGNSWRCCSAAIRPPSAIPIIYQKRRCNRLQASCNPLHQNSGCRNRDFAGLSLVFSFFLPFSHLV